MMTAVGVGDAVTSGVALGEAISVVDAEGVGLAASSLGELLA